ARRCRGDGGTRGCGGPPGVVRAPWAAGPGGAAPAPARADRPGRAPLPAPLSSDGHRTRRLHLDLGGVPHSSCLSISNGVPTEPGLPAGIAIAGYNVPIRRRNVPDGAPLSQDALI